MLTAAHWIFLVFVLIVIATMMAKKDVVIPCAIGLFVMGWAVRGSFIGGIQAIFNGVVAAGNEFMGIIVVISLVVALSKALGSCGVDALIMKPAQRLMVNANLAFWILGVFMLVVTWVIWPSPAVALIGAIMVPVAMKAGLPAIGAAIAMNLFGHGIGLSSDWIIQGAPGLTAKTAGCTATDITAAGWPLYLVMGLVTTIVAFVMLKKDMKKDINALHALQIEKTSEGAECEEYTKFSKAMALIVPLAFVADVVLMIAFDLKGGDATALLGGTALIVTVVLAFGQFKMEALGKVTDFIRSGFMFGIKIFAPVMVIGAFFFLGGEGTAKAVLGPEGKGYMIELAQAFSTIVPLNKIAVAIGVMITSILTGLDGSGFSGLPLVGSLSAALGSQVGANVPALAALGQLGANWCGGGTIIPWGVIPVAAICGVDPVVLARKNFVPVVIGFAAVTLFAMVLI